MTRKDYKIIAEAMRMPTRYAVYVASAEARSQHALMCNEMATALAKDNTLFKRVVFLQACGLDDNTIDAL